MSLRLVIGASGSSMSAPSMRINKSPLRQGEPPSLVREQRHIWRINSNASVGLLTAFCIESS